MPIIATVKQPEQWVLEVNGGYDILFTEVTLAGDAVDGEVITAPVNGIVSKGGKTGDLVRVMVRGNPTKVDSAQLTGSTTGLDASIVLV